MDAGISILCSFYVWPRGGYQAIRMSALPFLVLLYFPGPASGLTGPGTQDKSGPIISKPWWSYPYNTAGLRTYVVSKFHLLRAKQLGNKPICPPFVVHVSWAKFQGEWVMCMAPAFHSVFWKRCKCQHPCTTCVMSSEEQSRVENKRNAQVPLIRW